MVVSVAQKLSAIEERLQDPKLFVSRRKLQDKGHNPEKSVLGSGPGEDVFCSSVTKHDRREPRTKLFVSAGRLQEQRLQTQKLFVVRVPVKTSLGIIIFSYNITISIK
jgi:hypothetical protein